VDNILYDYLLRKQPQIDPPVGQIETPLMSAPTRNLMPNMPQQQIPAVAGMGPDIPTPTPSTVEQISQQINADQQPVDRPGLRERIMAKGAQGPEQPGDDLGRKTKSAAVMNAILSGISGLGDLNVFGGGGLRGGQQAPQTTDRMGKHFGMQDKIMAPLQQKRAMEDQAKLATKRN
jgi:hypothetical protein